MQKVDLVITIVGVAAVVATTLGVVLYDEIAGADELTFDVIMEDGYFMDGEDGVSSGNHEYAFAVADNGTSATIDVTITFAGQSRAGSDIAVSAYFVDPTGNRSAEDSDTLSIGQNEGAGASVTLSLSRTWAEVPEGGNQTDIDAAAEAARLSWENRPLIVYVTIAADDDALSGVPNPTGGNVAFYRYDIAVAGDLERFERAEREQPDPSTV